MGACLHACVRVGVCMWCVCGMETVRERVGERVVPVIDSWADDIISILTL